MVLLRSLCCALFKLVKKSQRCSSQVIVIEMSNISVASKEQWDKEKLQRGLQAEKSESGLW